MTIITYWHTLFALARDVGAARASGDEEAIKVAESKLQAYEDLVLMSDEMRLDIPYEYL